MKDKIRTFPRAVAVAGLLAALGPLGSPATAAPDLSKFAPAAMHPALVAAALTNHIPLEGVDTPTNSGTINPGDSVTALLTFHQKGAPAAQWLIYVEAISPGPKDKPPKPTPPTVLYASTGEKMEFASSPAWVELRALGPFQDAAGAKKPPVARDDRSRFTLDKGFLGLGMDRAAEAVIRMERWRATTGRTNEVFTIATAAPSPEKARQGKAFAEQMHLTVEDQRAIAGACPAMMSYFEVVGETPHLEELMFKVVDLPSVWSVVGHLGVSADLQIDAKHFAPAETSMWPLPAQPPVYYLPMEFLLNHRPGIRISLAVTTPRPPYLACGGIIGILAEKPSQNETYLTLRLLSAKLAHLAARPPPPR